MWTKEQIEQHKKAAELLYEIVLETAKYFKKNQDATEYEAKVFVRKLFRKYGLKTDKGSPMIAFRENTQFVHYYPEENTAKKLQPESLILFDLWGRINEKGAPYADITLMLYFGKKLPKDFEKFFCLAIRARDEAVKFIRNNLRKENIPTGKKIDQCVCDYLHKHGHADKFLHGTGHSLGFTYAHGRRTSINRRGRQKLPINVGYTIEPGIYFKDRFGFRSEIDFYINEKLNLILTTKVQNKIIKIN